MDSRALALALDSRTVEPRNVIASACESELTHSLYTHSACSATPPSDHDAQTILNAASARMLRVSYGVM